MNDHPDFPAPEKKKVTFTVGQSATYTFPGSITRREYFAAMAMQGYLSNRFIMEKLAIGDDNRSLSVRVVFAAIEYADALIVELDKEK